MLGTALGGWVGPQLWLGGNRSRTPPFDLVPFPPNMPIQFGKGWCMKRVIAAGCIAAALIGPLAEASAQAIYGMAGVQCGQYLKAARSSDILYHQASQWLLGYVSGM